MNGELIKSFLVGLGFSIDENSLAKFNKAIATASLRVTALYTSIKLLAAGVFYSISKISEGFEQMGYEYRIIAPAINKALALRRELLKAYAAAGINITKVVQESVKFNFSLAKTKFALEAIYKSVGAKFLPLLTKQMDVFRQKIYANMPKIQNALEKFVKFIFKAFEGTTILGSRVFSILERVWDFFGKLHVATSGWSTGIIAAIAAWHLLNLAFIATPLGALITGLVTLLALWDDFKTAQEGGESLFDWKEGPLIKIIDLFKILYELVKDTAKLIYHISDLNFGGMVKDIGNLAKAFWSLNGAVEALVRSLHIEWIDKLLAWRDRVENKTFSAFGGGSAPYFNQSNFATPPIGVGGNTSNISNHKVNLETNVTVQGSADAQSIDSIIGATQSYRDNFDMVRNLKGATR